MPTEARGRPCAALVEQLGAVTRLGRVGRDIAVLRDALARRQRSVLLHVLDEQVPTALDLLTDLLISPRFTHDDVEMERGVILEEIMLDRGAAAIESLKDEEI